jgi:hypothetical protein
MNRGPGEKPRILVQAETNPVLLAQIVEEVGPRFKEIVESFSTQALQRYNIRSGRIFGTKKGDERFKIIDIAGNTVVYKNLAADKTEYKNIDDLLESWNLRGFVEISPVDQILSKLKTWLTPFLGGVLVSALISWLMKKLGR